MAKVVMILPVWNLLFRFWSPPPQITIQAESLMELEGSSHPLRASHSPPIEVSH